MNPLHPAALSIDKLLESCDIKTTPRGGPGGQHRNKVESAIVITHRPSKIIGQAGERRSQHENRRVAIERLRLNLAIGVRREPDQVPAPSELWKSRVSRQKISVSPEHSDFPGLLAEALDTLQATRFEVSPAAEWLGISGSQLVKFVKLVPAAFAWLNQNRVESGLKSLK